eukprot:TRINITY_DN1059_c0_g1_i1.p1 TRINITY_DN1059_c0_g1~~TRINITY_DN1059_c0_g1_i1.p1  ORF type:complete len:214 (-),score=54.86 TRINITY_DN1059_c0_g1_i1:50-691(-)
MAFKGIPSDSDFDKFFEEFRAVAADESDWADVSEKLEVKVTQKYKEGNPISLIRGRGIVKATPSAVRDLLWSLDQRGKWDVVFDSGKIVKEIEAGKKIVAYYKTKSTSMVWARDFAVAIASREESNGAHTLVCKSVEVPDLVPLDSSCVRGVIHLCGFLLEPTGEGNAHTRVTYIFQVDGSGWVPTALQNSVNTYQPLGIIGIRKILTGSPKP